MRTLVLTQCVHYPKRDLIRKLFQRDMVRVRIVVGPIFIEYLVVTGVGGILIVFPCIVRQKQNLDVRIRRVDCVQGLGPVQIHGLNGLAGDSRYEDLGLFLRLDRSVLRHGRNGKSNCGKDHDNGAYPKSFTNHPAYSFAPNLSTRRFLVSLIFSSRRASDVASQMNLRYGSVLEGRMLNHQSGNSTL